MQPRKRLHFSFISATEKSVTFLCADKNATFFVKRKLYKKSRYARQKVLTDIFDGYNPIASGVLPPRAPPLRGYLHAAAQFFDRIMQPRKRLHFSSLLYIFIIWILSECIAGERQPFVKALGKLIYFLPVC